MEPPVASPPSAKCGPVPGVDVYNPNLSIKEIFGDLSGGSLLDAIFATYQVGEKTRVKFFLDQNSTDHTNFPFHSRQVGIVRHQHNQRMHSGIKKAYVKSCCARGICEGVRGEAWLTEPKPDSFGHRTGPFQALTYGSLCEAFYSALCQEPENQNLHRTLGRGFEARVFSHKLPDSIAKYIVKMHNRFHGGASTNFVELVQVVPDVEFQLTKWKSENGVNWSSEDYEAKCANWLRSHQDFGETFSEWKLYESARSAFNLFSKRLENWEDFMAEMCECCDYGNAKLVNSTVLQNMVYCTQAILPQLWDGTTDEDLKLLVMETLRLCVPLLEDAGEQNWIFDSMSKKGLIHRLFTVMVGSVVCTETATSGGANKKRKATNAPGQKRAKAKAKAKAAPSGVQEIGIPEESDMKSTTVSCSAGVRQKLWVDDLLGLANHVVSSLKQNNLLQSLPAAEFDHVKRDIVRIGLIFALKGLSATHQRREGEAISKVVIVQACVEVLCHQASGNGLAVAAVATCFTSSWQCFDD